MTSSSFRFLTKLKHGNKIKLCLDDHRILMVRFTVLESGESEAQISAETGIIFLAAVKSCPCNRRIMSHKRLSRCGIENCKSTSFYLNDGQWFCKKGHLREVNPQPSIKFAHELPTELWTGRA